MRFCRSLLAVVFLALPCFAFAQSTNASLTGFVDDPAKALLSGVSITAINTETGVRAQTFTNSSGQYVLPNLIPGTYRVEVDKQGFRGVIEAGLVLHVQDIVQMNFHMAIGSASETVSVDAGGNQINTTDASVSTVVDRQFVEDMPLNGRSFQSLILLAPGVLTTSPQVGTVLGENGEFSVNGQRTDSNSFSIDGLSGNNGAFASSSAAAAGSAGGLPSSTALGTTQALVSIDALQEFRISTSTYSAEYGRQPGAQISFQTRSGTNDFHGTAFEYLRNTVLDANNWFNDDNNPVIPKTPERQNDFGGVFGGPIDIPKLYSGKDRLFFFFSYEGLRLTQPQAATITYVPSNGTDNTATYSNPLYKNLRANAPAALQPVLNAFPKPNCTIAENPQCIDYGDGLSPYIVSTSLPSSLDSISARVDFQAAPWLRLFFRYADTPSSAVTSVTTFTDATNFKTQTVAFGADSTISASSSNQFRLGYSPTIGATTYGSTTLGGGIPFNLLALQGGSGQGIFGFDFPNGETPGLAQAYYGTRQHQWNLTDTYSWTHGAHNFRAGLNYLRTTSYLNQPGFSFFPFDYYIYESASSILQNSLDYGQVEVASEQDPAFTTFSAFIQDEWRLNRRLGLSLGVRWELNPPPSVVGGTQQRTLDGNISDPSTLTLAAAGTPLYKTTYYNFAPRLGVAAILRGQPENETVLRAGGGVYFDTGQDFYELYGQGLSPGLRALAVYGGSTTAAFPFTSSQMNVVPSLAPPYEQMFVVSRSLQLPYTLQWNVSVEQALGKAQSFTVGYVGSNGRRLLELQAYVLSSLNPDFTSVEIYQNGLTSNYNALQTQYKRTLSRGLQVLAAYTWSHALDYASQDAGILPYQYGNSDFDVRNNFTTALSYNLPGQYGERWQQTILGGWGTDLQFTARTGFPVQLSGPEGRDPSGNVYFSMLNYNSSDPYLYKSGIPGGRQFNPAVFSVPLAGESGNSPRNFLRGFGENEINLAIRREFPLKEQLHLQFRAEAFNLFNHPNFGSLNLTCGTSTPGATCTNPLLGQATDTLANALGGGLSQLYQQGGPRSLQLAVKLIF
jgi:hypothetical protein